MLDIDISTDAADDIQKLYDYIAYELLNEDAAFGYWSGIYETIEKLSYLGEVIAFSQQPYIQKHFGMFARTITYKKMTIVYETIAKLSYLGEVIAFSQQPYIQKHFGMFARTITYKKMTIVYETISGVAYVHRVIPSKLIH